MRLALCSLLLSSTALALGQSQPQKAETQNHIPAFVPPATLRVVGPLNMECPVDMTAERQASSQTQWVVSLEDGPLLHRTDNERKKRAGVHVELVGSKGKTMKQAEVAVYYLAPGIHSLPVDQGGGATATASDLKKTFVLSSVEGAPTAQLAASLLVGNTASITRVRLLRIDYTDGSTWQTTRGSGCSVEPGLLMAVATR